MLQMDEAGRKRLVLLAGIVGLILGSMMVMGLVERFRGTVTPSAEVRVEEIEKIRREAKRFKQIRAQLLILAKANRWSELSTRIEQTKEVREILPPFLQAEIFERSGQEKKAANAWQQAIMPADPVSFAAHYLFKNETRKYQDYCRSEVERVPLTASTLEANNTAWLTVLAPNALNNYDKAIALARKAAEGATDEDRPNYLNTLGAVLVRAGQTTEAVTVLEQAEAIRPEPFNWSFLAMAYAREGNREKAITYRDKLRKLLNGTYATPQRQENRHELVRFYMEAERLLEESATKSL